MKRTTRRHRSDSEIEKILADYRRSGLSQKAFSDRRAVPLSTLTYWLTRERRGKSKPRKKEKPSAKQLVPVHLVDELSARDHGLIEVESARGYLIRVPVGIDPTRLARYVHALEARC